MGVRGIQIKTSDNCTDIYVYIRGCVGGAYLKLIKHFFFISLIIFLTGLLISVNIVKFYKVEGSSMGKNWTNRIAVCVKSFNYKVGDVIVYNGCDVNYCFCNSGECYVIHRIIGQDINGCYNTKGDANKFMDLIGCLTKDKIKCKVVFLI